MKQRYFLKFAFVMLFTILLLPSFTANANSDKIELTIIDATPYKQGFVFCRGDEEEWADIMEGWQRDFTFLVAFDEATQEYAPVVLESIDISDVDIYTVGEYHVRINMKLEDSYTDRYYIRDENCTVDIPIYISDETGLKMHLVLDASFAYKFAWYAPVEFLPSDVLYLEVDADTYYTEEELIQAPWLICDDYDIATLSMNLIYILKPLPKDTAYYFCVKVGDDYTDIVRVSYTDPPTISDSAGMGGNRDGDDHEEPEHPPLFQPAPDDSKDSPETGDSVVSSGGAENSGTGQGQNSSSVAGPEQDSSNVAGPAGSSSSHSSGNSRSSSSSTALETVTATNTTMSGARIRMLLDTEEEFITFAWSGICLRIPKDYFLALNLSDEDLFSVEMKRTANNSFTLSVAIDGKELTELAPSSVQLSVADTDIPYTLYLDNNKLNTTVACQDGCAIFDVTRTGTYQLRTEGQADTVSEVSNGSGTHRMFFPVAAVLMLIFITGILIYLRVRRKRRPRL